MIASGDPVVPQAQRRGPRFDGSGGQQPVRAQGAPHELTCREPPEAQMVARRGPVALECREHAVSGVVATALEDEGPERRRAAVPDVRIRGVGQLEAALRDRRLEIGLVHRDAGRDAIDHVPPRHQLALLRRA